jgi:PTH1 family peptidyl-tRNA hydrolase
VWTLVPLGNPGPDYAATRHNLGRLMLQRWMEDRGLAPKPARKFPSGNLYPLMDRLQALVPTTYMNLSGEACAQADGAGIYARRMVLLYDDKDLPLGLGRFRLDGSDGGHNGLKSVFHHLGTEKVARLRLGIGPFQRPLHDFVLGEWTEAEWDRIEGMDAPFEAFLDRLAAAEELGALGNQVNGEPFWRPRQASDP